jgi:hypothetical protein
VGQPCVVLTRVLTGDPTRKATDNLETGSESKTIIYEIELNYNGEGMLFDLSKQPVEETSKLGNTLKN